MRYAFTFAALAAIAATSLAAPVIDRRATRVLVFTETTTIITTETVIATEYVPPTSTSTPDVKVEAVNHNSRTRQFTRPASVAPAPAPTSVQQSATSAPPAPLPETTVAPVVVPTSVPEPVVAPTSAAEPVVITISTPPPPPVAIPTPTPAPEPATSSKPVTTAPAPAPVTTGSFETQVLAAHNKRRAAHGAPPLKYDATMASFAKSVSAKCIFAHSGGEFGENLAAGYSNPTAAIDAWYEENTSYNYSAGMFSSKTGHFTQMVWVGATSFGCGIATCNGNGGTPGDFLTCEYNTGNVIGQFVENVLPPIS